MKLILLSVGKHHESYVTEGIAEFTKRINRYYGCEWKILAAPKNAALMEPDKLRQVESLIIMQHIEAIDFTILLDERGKMLTSPLLAKLIGERAVGGSRKINFIIGGAFGVSDLLRQKADLVWQLSQLVFPHQLVRLLLAEQVYRACCILNNEKYHHA